jgi:hypothetical protein
MEKRKREKVRGRGGGLGHYHGDEIGRIFTLELLQVGHVSPHKVGG